MGGQVDWLLRYTLKHLTEKEDRARASLVNILAHSSVMTFANSGRTQTAADYFLRCDAAGGVRLTFRTSIAGAQCEKRKTSENVRGPRHYRYRRRPLVWGLLSAADASSKKTSMLSLAYRRSSSSSLSLFSKLVHRGTPPAEKWYRSLKPGYDFYRLCKWLGWLKNRHDPAGQSSFDTRPVLTAYFAPRLSVRTYRFKESTPRPSPPKAALPRR